MRIGVTLPVTVIGSGQMRSLAELAEDAVRAEELGFDSLWVMDHIWIDRNGRRVGGHEPMMLLAFLAARTSRISLGTLVVCNGFRHPGQLAREAVALADATDGRFILGVGAGWYEAEYDAFGFPFDHKVGRLQETLEVLGPLLAGERVSKQGRFLQLRDAEVVSRTAAPPIWVAGSGVRLLDLTARYAGGWNSAWHGPDPSTFGSDLARLRAGAAAAGRDPGSIETSAGIFVLPLADDELDRLESRARALLGLDPTLPYRDALDRRALVGGPERIAECLRAYAQTGADHAILALSVVPFGLLDRGYMDRVAGALKLVNPA